MILFPQPRTLTLSDGEYVLPLQEAYGDLAAFYQAILPYLNGGTGVVDSAMSSSSDYPVKNKVIQAALNAKQDTVTAGVGLSKSGATLTNEAMIFSTSEKRVGTWIDGKPLYQKVVSFGALPNASNKNVAHGISNLKQVLLCIAMTMESSGTCAQLPYVNNSQLNKCINYTIDRTNITVSTAADRSTFVTTYFTLVYTKTTD